MRISWLLTRKHDDEADAGGWISGTEDAATPVGPAGNISDHSSDPGDWVAHSLFNITTVRYLADLKRVMTAADAGYPGCRTVMGHNNPLQSPHPGGILAANVGVDGMRGSDLRNEGV